MDASLAFSRESVADFARQKVDLMLAEVRARLGDPERLSFLDVGCGTGVAESFLAGRVGRLVASDVSSEMIAQAVKRCSRAEFVHTPPGEKLPFPDGAFDVQFCYCVFHHVPPEERPRFVAEIARVTKPGGLVFCFEHNPYNPLTVHVVKNCPLDDDAVLLRPRETRSLMRSAGLRVVGQRFYIFFPRFLAFLRPLEARMGWLPLGGQYYSVSQKPLA